MKKIVFTLVIMFCSLVVTAQHYETLHVENLDDYGVSVYCVNDNDLLGTIIYGFNNSDQTWSLYTSNAFGETIPIIDTIIGDSIIISKPDDEYSCRLSNNVGFNYYILFRGLPKPHSWVENFQWTDSHSAIRWKKQNETIQLYAGPEVTQWSTGATTESIIVSEPGTYSVTVTNDCGSATYSVEVRDKVELYRATCDLVTNRNQLTWQVTEAQAQYISAVKVYRNSTELVATVPYTDGTFTDNIGSEATQWQYHIVAVDSDGNDCPIPSRWKRTIHLDRVQGAQGNQILQWTPYEEESPTKETVEAYGIYDIVNGEARHVIDVGSFTNVYAYNPADFMGYGAVAAKFAESSPLKRGDDQRPEGLGFETLAFSNHTIVPLDVEENKTSIFTVYPNPSDGRFTVEGTGRLTITNVLGQTILTRDITDTETIDLPSGVWFVRLNEITRKIVVE